METPKNEQESNSADDAGTVTLSKPPFPPSSQPLELAEKRSHPEDEANSQTTPPTSAAFAPHIENPIAPPTTTADMPLPPNLIVPPVATAIEPPLATEVVPHPLEPTFEKPGLLHDSRLSLSEPQVSLTEQGQKIPDNGDGAGSRRSTATGNNRMEQGSSAEPKLKVDERSVDLELINVKRQEERMAFQKLIGEITELKSEVEKLQNVKGELETQLDVLSIELDEEKERTADSKKRIKNLETQLNTFLAKESITTADKETMELQTGFLAKKLREENEEKEYLQQKIEDVNQEKADYEATLKDLKNRIKRMTHDDEAKMQRMAKLEETISTYKRLLDGLSEVVGREKMEEMKHKAGQQQDSDHQKRETAQSNALRPPVPSRTCALL